MDPLPLIWWKKPGELREQNHLFFTATAFSFPFSFPSLHPLQWCNSRSHAPSVYSLYPDRKDIRLSDQRAGAGARRINEASGWREGGREKGRGRLGQVGWQAHNQRRNRWGLLLSSDKRLQPSSGPTKPDPCWQELLFPMLMSSVLFEVTLQKEKRGTWFRKQQDSIWFICFCERCLLKTYIPHMGTEHPLMWCDKCPLHNEIVCVCVGRKLRSGTFHAFCLTAHCSNATTDDIDLIYWKTMETSECLLRPDLSFFIHQTCQIFPFVSR